MPIAIGLEPSASALLSRAVPLPHGLDGYAVSCALSSDVESLFVSRLRLTAACLLMGALGGICVVVGFQSQWKEPLPDLLRRRIKRFLATREEIVGEFDLDSVEGASSFAAVLDRVCGARHTEAVDLRDALKRVTEKKAANIDPQAW